MIQIQMEGVTLKGYVVNQFPNYKEVQTKTQKMYVYYHHVSLYYSTIVVCIVELKLENYFISSKVLTIRKTPSKCGSYTFNDGSRYIGDFDENGIKCGKGHLETPNGATFEGQFNKGLPNGLGVMKFPDGSKYEGEFMQGWFHGHGMFIAGDGSKFEGANS